MSAHIYKITGIQFKKLLDDVLGISADQFVSNVKKELNLHLDRSTVYRWLKYNDKSIPKSGVVIIKLYCEIYDCDHLYQYTQSTKEENLYMPLTDYINKKDELAEERIKIRDALNEDAKKLAEMDRFCVLKVPKNKNDLQARKVAHFIKIATTYSVDGRKVNDELLEEVVEAAINLKLGKMGFKDGMIQPAGNLFYAGFSFVREGFEMMLIIISGTPDGQGDFEDLLELREKYFKSYTKDWVDLLQGKKP